MSDNNIDDKKYISVDDAAEMANVTAATIRNWIKSFEIGIKVGGRLKVDASKLDEVLKGNIHYEGYKKKENNEESG